METVYRITNTRRLFYFLSSKVWLHTFEFVCCVHRSSHQRYSVKKGVLRNFAKFTGKHLCQSLFFNKVGGGAFFTEHVWATAYIYNSLLERNVVYHSQTQKQLWWSINTNNEKTRATILRAKRKHEKNNAHIQQCCIIPNNVSIIWTHVIKNLPGYQRQRRLVVEKGTNRC